MENNRKKFKRNYQRSKRSSDYMDNSSYGYQGKPEKEGAGRVANFISLLALRGLPHSSYSVQADPYTAALPGSEPYPLLNPFNRLIGGVYGGLRNLDGGNVQQYANSVQSKMLNYFDFMYNRVGVNYRYLPSKMPDGFTNASAPYPGKLLIDEQRRAIAEATSVLQSTTFSTMAINNYMIATDMPMGNAVPLATKYTPTDQSGVELNVYAALPDVLYGALRYYQEFWLKALNVFNWHNSFRLKMGTMIRSSWNRETPNLNALFGLFKKKSFLSLLDSMSLAFNGEYIDKDFMFQVNTLSLMPSRRSNSLTDPVLELGVDINTAPNFYLLISTDGESPVQEPIFSSFSDLKKVVPGIGSGETFDTACSSVVDMLAATNIMKWARTEPQTQNDNSYYNSVKAHFDVINLCITTFKTKFTDVREVLDTIGRAGLNTWYKGFQPSIVKDTDAALFRNKIIDDIFKMQFSGAVTVEMDAATKRWKTYSLWNMYDGIPSYDMYSGGSFLTFSLKTVVSTGDADNVINYMPVGLTPYKNEKITSMASTAVNRIGSVATITPTAVTMDGNVVFDRLAPLVSQNDLQLRVATVVTADTTDFSILYKELSSIYGACAVSTNGSTFDYGLDPDVLAVYQIEIEDITNEAINYARLHAPFRGAVSEIPKFGFLGQTSK